MNRALVVGSGPNGLAAAIALLQGGVEVEVHEAAAHVGGGLHTEELTLPGFLHDVCATVQPLAAGSPFFRTLDLPVEWVQPGAPAAHPLDDGTAVAFDRSIEVTAASIGGSDGDAYRKLMEPLVDDAERLLPSILGPLRPPRHPLALARFGLLGLRSAEGLAKRFDGPRVRALIAGNAAHSMLRLDASPTGAVALVLMLTGHAVGWPVARGGSQKVADALASIARSHGAEIVTGHRVERIEELDDARAVLFDLTPRQIVQIAGHRLPARYRNALERYRYGPGVFKLDWALDGPIPWTAPECRRAGTVHVGGTFEELAASEAAPGGPRPYVLLSQPTVCDPSRAPAGKHVGWAYCHVPAGSTADMTEIVEGQVERFAPGFRDLIIGRASMNAAEMEAYNPNYVGGDINGGLMDLRQLFARPVARPVPYTTPDERLFICSSATPPGGGVHGMCGYFAAQAALRRG